MYRKAAAVPWTNPKGDFPPETIYRFFLLCYTVKNENEKGWTGSPAGLSADAK